MKPTMLEFLATEFASTHPQETSRALAELPAAEAAHFLETCSSALAGSIARQLTALEFVACLHCMTVDRAAAVLVEMPLEKVASALRRMSTTERNALADTLPRDLRRRLQALLEHPQETAGALMEPLVFSVGPRMTAGQVLESLARHSVHLRYYVYVVDEGECLLGVVDLRRLMSAGRDKLTEDLMVRDPERISSRAGRRAIVSHPAWDRVHTLPVVDERNVLLGILRHQRVRQLERSESARVEGGSARAALADLFWSGSQRVIGELMGLAARRPL